MAQTLLVVFRRGDLQSAAFFGLGQPLVAGLDHRSLFKNISLSAQICNQPENFRFRGIFPQISQPAESFFRIWEQAKILMIS
jgi:hypothetical protein